MSLMVQRAKDVNVGNPLDPQTTMGPIANSNQASMISDYIDKGSAEGATLLYGGKRLEIDGSNLYVEPTIFGDVTNDMVVAREEIFGPVLSVIGFDTEQQAIEIANDTPFGLAAALWTDNLSRAHRVAGKLKAGTVSVNTVVGALNSQGLGAIYPYMPSTSLPN